MKKILNDLLYIYTLIIGIIFILFPLMMPVLFNISQNWMIGIFITAPIGGVLLNHFLDKISAHSSKG